MIQQFTITDIRRTLVDGTSGRASVVLTPVVPEGQTLVPTPQPFGTGTMNPSAVQLTGISATDVDGWSIGDTITLTGTKV